MRKKVVLITGGSSGIGKAIGQYLTQKGYEVFGTTRNLAKNQGFSDFQLLEMDVHNAQSVATAVSQVITKSGRIDVLINNAGVGITGPIEETPDTEIHHAFETNLYGPIRVMKSVLPHMREQGSGFIINITSIAGYMGLPYRGIYSATKGALELVTESIRMEVKGFGVRVTNLAPGDFATNIASGRYHSPVRNDSPYKEPYGFSLETMNAHVDQGQEPMVVAEKVYRLLQKEQPKVHYLVGSFMQRFSIVLKKLLPDRMYERMLLNHYKL
jgi:NAD(P)-dependent dehydrogenase (short-subunit alcohol dehydrogenase family)